MAVSASGVLTATTTQGNGNISSVTFTSGNAAIATATSPDNAPPYNSTVTGVGGGTTSVTAQGIMSGIPRCSTTTTVNVTSAGPWWQAVNGDVISGGDLISKVPSATLKFMLPGTGTYPGVAVYNGNYDFTVDSGTQGTPSEKGWLASSLYKGRNYTGLYFLGNFSTSIVYNDIPNSVTGGGTFNGGSVSPDGFFWFRRAGDLTINGNIGISGTRKVVLVVNGGNLTISGDSKIDVPGQGTFIVMVIKDASGVGGNLNVDPSVKSLNGMFFADGAITTGTGSNQLNVLGSFVAGGGVSLQRDLGVANAATAAEIFTYDPRLILLLPRQLGVSRTVWREIAP